MCALDIWILDPRYRGCTFNIIVMFRDSFLSGTHLYTVRKTLWRALRNGRRKNSIIAGRKIIIFRINNYNNNAENFIQQLILYLNPVTSECCTFYRVRVRIIRIRTQHARYVSYDQCHLPLAQIVKIIIIIW